MSITPSSAPTLRRIYVDFLGSLSSLPSDSTAPECMKYALGRLAELAADPSIASRSLKSPMSFSLVPSCARQSKGLLNTSMQEATNTGFLPFPHDYRSERKCVVVSPLPIFFPIGLSFSHAQQILRTHEGTLSSKERFTSARSRRLVRLAHRMPIYDLLFYRIASLFFLLCVTHRMRIYRHHARRTVHSHRGNEIATRSPNRNGW